MTKRPTLQSVADAAGVSPATVDRVFNGRLLVREATALRVIEAAERIGYHGAGLMRDRLRAKLGERNERYTLGFCLQKRADPFYQTFARILTETASRHEPERCSAVIEYMDELDPASIARTLVSLGEQVDALGVVAVDHPHVTAAIESLHAQGKPTVTLLSDLSAPLRAGYIGVDPRKSGRTAAWAVSRLNQRKTGTVGVFVGTPRYLGQESCEISFRSYLREHAPGLRVLDTQINLEDKQLAYEATLAMLARHDDLAGIYVPGGGVGGVIRALREEALGRRIVTVCSDLMPDRYEALVDGVIDLVIDTPLQRIAETAVQAMLRALQALPGEAAQASQYPLPAQLYTPENV
ncbi:LacI family DNA-binding transcriptional regulator [Caballeronia sp. BR00000012568055]|uniref:LacI family DNA-binding transcriptional regulator n=1 Tax=Caballeronia sp. BR00000012568055 TaxID=2918761 RepID=UPI0023F6F0F2|nr:LacI family DNA-binding transcriptional regulator [Caballeronia sp. BR00000012568055]